ncbi:MAG: DNA polymerase III subunit alpha [Bacillota bacterium]|nr:DNA polymerase III subunit alpha [Bacillota bacterium]
MPERGHPWHEDRAFVHLHVHSPFSFLDGACELESMLVRAASLGMPAIALTDHDNVCAATEFARGAAALGIKAIQGAEVSVRDAGHLTLLATGPAGYAMLCGALTAAHLGNPRLQPALDLGKYWGNGEDVGGNLIALTGCRRGLIARSILAGDYPAALRFGCRLRDIFGPAGLFVELEGCMLPGTRGLNARLVELAEELGVGYVATNNVHYLEAKDFPTHDLLTCVRTLTRLDQVHPERRLNAQNYLKSGGDMAASLWDLPPVVIDRALRASLDIAARCEPVLRLGQVRQPRFGSPDGESAAAMLRRLTYEGARTRYSEISPTIRRRLEHELDVICRLGYEEYFLLVWDVVAFARRRGIRCAGRGSAADSAVAYCLFITDVDSIRRGLLFERFMSLERAELPDIDVDFDARKRDDVTRYVYERYGKDHVATVATYNTFHARSAVRDLGKAMGFSPAELDRLAKTLPWGMNARRVDSAFEELPELRDSGIPAVKYRRLAAAAAAVAGFPRHLSTHLGGVVISSRPLTEITPLQMAAKGVVVTQFDKVGVEELGLVKLDLLSLRTLGAVDDALLGINRGRIASERLGYERIPHGDPDTYAMLHRGETVGAFQLESPAQRALQARLGAETFEDIVASVALIRPGPIKGNMVEPFIARRKGQEEVTYLHPLLEPILKKTYGVVLFQEQVIEIAITVAGFTPGEADRLRRVMTHGRSHEAMEDIGRFFVSKAAARGIEAQVAETIFSYVVGYASYGFCEAHAAAFGDIAYKTAYLVRHHPAHYFAAILSQQPMGYYPPHVLCVEARRRGVRILPPSVNRSEGDFVVEGEDAPAIRVGLRQVKAMSPPVLAALLEARIGGPFLDLANFLARTAAAGLDTRIAENLILCGALDGLADGGNRRKMVWHAGPLLQAARARDLPLYRSVREEPPASPQVHGGEAVPDFSPWERLRYEYEILGFTTGPHPMSFFRRRLAALSYLDSARLTRRRLAPGARVMVAGVPFRPHRPPTRSGRTVVFLSLEDEAGLIDVTIFENVYDRYGKLIFRDPAPPLAVYGRLDRRGNGVSVRAEEIHDLADVVGGAAAAGGRKGAETAAAEAWTTKPREVET